MSDRLSDSQMLKLVEIYQDYDCLWNVTSKLYRNRDARESAYKQIAERLNITGISNKDIPKKIKNLRSSYYQELKRIEASTRSGASQDSVYKPKVSWFTTADGFLRTFRNNQETVSSSFIAVAVSLNVCAQGCVIGISAVLLPALRDPAAAIRASPAQESWIASIIGFALIVGNFIITPTMDALGRRRSHLLTFAPMLAGWCLLLLARGVAGLIAARFLQGVSMGMLGPLGSVIIGETSDPRNRGMFLTLISLSLTTGVMITHGLSAWLTWQQIALICSFITFTSLVLSVYSPESPSWLLAQGRSAECRAVFRRLRGCGAAQEEELEAMIAAQTRDRKESVAAGASLRVRCRRNIRYFVETLKKPEFFKPIVIMFHMYTMFQFAGINVLSSYMMDIIREVVGPAADARFWMVALDLERLAANLLAVYLMKVLNRRTLLFSCGVVCVLAYLAKAAYVLGKQHDRLPTDAPWLPITLIAVYMFVLAVGISTVPFTVSGEIFPLAYRALGGGISVLALSLNLFVAVKCFPVLKGEIGLPLTYVLYATVVAYCLVVMWFMLPETKGRTLQDIEDSLKGRQGDRKASLPLKEVELQYSLVRRCSSQIIY